ncbi:unnamed protein product, partial [Meganyctiphanes norvegica]
MSRKRAPGPYSYDDDEDYVPSKGVKYSNVDERDPLKVKKHTLDSDEEEEDDGIIEKEPESYNETTQEGLDGQEDGALRLEDEQVITPFNMKEEMEEGHFDGDGFYHFKKDADIKDAWLEDIDWVKVLLKAATSNKYGNRIEASKAANDVMDAIANTAQAPMSSFKYIIPYPLLKPGETVARALKRYGGNKKISSAQRWKMKKKGGGGGDDTSSEMSSMLQLTELANTIIGGGNMDVYQETYEMINLKVQRSSAPPEVDMFGDLVEKKEDIEDKEVKDSKEQKDGEDHENGDTNEAENVPKVTWHLKWENTEEAETHGPFETSHMVAWQESGYFDKGAYVRKVSDEGGSWYSTKRIDFELYE